MSFREQLLPLISQMTPGKGAILTETIYRAGALKAEKDAFLDEDLLSLSILPRSEWLRREAEAFLPKGARVLTREETLRLLLKNILSETELYPHLFEEIFAQGGRPKAISRILQNLASYFETLRLWKFSSSSFPSSLDEWGNIQKGRERAEEEFHLFLSYEENLLQQGFYDFPALLSLFQEALVSEQGSLPGLPAFLVLDMPWNFSLLEQEVFRGISKRVPLVLLPNSPFSPATRFFQDQGGLPLAAVGDVKEGTGLAKCLENPPQPESVLHFSLQACRNRETEVRLALTSISTSLSQGRASAQSFHILSSRLEEYRDSLKRISRELSLPLFLAKPLPFLDSLAGRMLQAFLGWVLEPRVETLLGYLSFPMAQIPLAGEAEYSSFLKENGAFLLWETLEIEERERLTKLSPQKSVEALRTLLLRYGAIESDTSFLHPLLSQSATAREALLGLFYFQRERTECLRMAEKSHNLASSLRSYFASRRARMRSLREGMHPADLSESIASFRRLFTLTREVQESSQMYLPFSQTEASSAQRGLGTFLHLLHSKIGEESLSSSPDAEAQSAIIVTEFLDARALFRPLVFVLGCVESEFPVAVSPSLHFQHETTARKERAQSGFNPLTREEEGERLLAHLLSRAEEVVLTYPERVLDTELRFARLLEPLARIPLAQRRIERIVLVPQDGARDGGTDTLKSQWKAKIANSLASRRGLLWTAYDGDISSEKDLLAELLPSSLSVSRLEDLSDCRKRFYFRDLLGLPEDDMGFFGKLSSDYGDVVHQALASFYRRKECSLELLKTDFEAACRILWEEGKKALELSPRGWAGNVYERQRRKEVLRGLLPNESVGKRGPLVAALLYHRGLLSGWPVKIEEKVRFHIERELPGAKPLQITTTIDRIDQVGEGDSARFQVWDYKTGRVSTFGDQESGKSLQVPLYAEAVRQNFSEGKYPERGGFICLGNPNSDPKKEIEVTNGVILERLAVKGPQNKRVVDFSRVEENVKKAVSKVQELDRQIHQGDFRQELHTKHCEYCRFSGPCLRDETHLELKWDAEQIIEENGQALPRFASSLWNKEFSLLEEEKADPPLSVEQEIACDISKSIALRAGAGSGKTFVLRTRFLRHLLAGAPVDSIVAITFTEKAAAEIRERIQKAISQSLRTGRFGGRELSEEEKKRLFDAEKQLPRAQIGTIHSFAADLLKLAPDLGGLSPYQRVLSGSERKSLLDLALLEVESPGSEVEGDIEALLDSGLSPKNLRNQLLKFTSDERDFQQVLDTFEREGQQGKILPFLRMEWSRRVEKLGDLFLSFLPEWIQAFQNWLPSQDRLSEQELEVVQHLLGTVQKLRSLIQIRQEVAEKGLSWGECFFAAQEIFAGAAGLSNRMKQSKNMPRNFWKEGREFFARQDQEVSILSKPVLLENLGFSSLIHIARAVLALRRTFRRLKDERECIDFQDLIQGALRLVRGDLVRDVYQEARRERLLLPIRHHIRHLMVDEFQDTDPEQWALFQQLFLHSSESHLETLFLVGDYQQAIYGFRGGDVRVFEKATEELQKRGGESASLRDNYRSHPQIIDFCNKAFELFFSLDFDKEGNPRQGGVVKPQPLSAKGKFEKSSWKGNQRVFLLDTNTEENRKRKASPGGNDEAEAVASFLQGVLKNRENWDGLRHENRKIAVLTRSLKDLSRVRSALEERKIHFELGKNSGFFDLDECQSVILLLRLLRHPEDPIALIGVLRSSLGALDDREIFRLRSQLGGEWQRFWSAPLDNVVLECLRDLLIQARQLAKSQFPSQVLQRVLQESPLSEAFLERGEEGAASSLALFLEMIRAKERELPGGGNLHEIGLWIDALDETSAPATFGGEEGGAAEITLMTMHAAKGLEFGMVVLPFLHPRAREEHDFRIGEFEISPESEPYGSHLLGMQVEDEDGEWVRRKSFVQWLIAESAKARKAAEERRLFYVACTRAKQYLIISGQNLSHEEGFQDGRSGEPEILEDAYLSPHPSVWLEELAGGLLAPLLPALVPGMEN